jgi:hypothetical protein
VKRFSDLAALALVMLVAAACLFLLVAMATMPPVAP